MPTPSMQLLPGLEDKKIKKSRSKMKCGFKCETLLYISGSNRDKTSLNTSIKQMNPFIINSMGQVVCLPEVAISPREFNFVKFAIDTFLALMCHYEVNVYCIMEWA